MGDGIRLEFLLTIITASYFLTCTSGPHSEQAIQHVDKCEGRSQRAREHGNTATLLGGRFSRTVYKLRRRRAATKILPGEEERKHDIAGVQTTGGRGEISNQRNWPKRSTTHAAIGRGFHAA